MHDVRPIVMSVTTMCTAHSVIVCVPFLFEAYVAHYHHEHNSVIVMAEKLLHYKCYGARNWVVHTCTLLHTHACSFNYK